MMVEYLRYSQNWLTMEKIEKYCVGTAQIGIAGYGIANLNKSIPDANQIFDYAISNKILKIDTSNYYGKINEIICNYSKKEILDVYTKIGSDKDLDFFLENCKIDRVKGCYIHHFKDYKQDRKILDNLYVAQKKGKVEKIGFSIYEKFEIDEILNANLKIQMIQLPYNVLDQRFEVYFKDLKNLGIEINVRSCFLQGLLLKDDLLISKNDFVNNKVNKTLRKFKDICSKYNISNIQACYLFCNEIEYVDQVIVGCDSVDQLKQNIKNFSDIKIKRDDIIDDIRKISIDDKRIILPFNWEA